MHACMCVPAPATARASPPDRGARRCGHRSSKQFQVPSLYQTTRFLPSSSMAFGRSLLSTCSRDTAHHCLVQLKGSCRHAAACCSVTNLKTWSLSSLHLDKEVVGQLPRHLRVMAAHCGRLAALACSVAWLPMWLVCCVSLTSGRSMTAAPTMPPVDDVHTLLDRAAYSRVDT